MSVTDARVDGNVDDLEALVELLVSVRDEEHLPGLVAAVKVGGHDATVALGDADLDGQTPIDATLPLRLSSLIKPFTALAVALLVDEGRVDIDEPVSRYLTSIDVDPRVTIRHLVTHSSGLVREGYFHVDTDEERPKVADFYGVGPLTATFEPGTAAEYSNHGYAVLGQLVEDAAGQPFTQLLTSRVLAPIGVTIDFTEGGLRTNGFEVGESGRAVVPNYIPVLTPASGGWATVTNALGLPAAMIGDGSNPPLSVTVRALIETNTSPDGLPARAFGWAISRVGKEVVLSHAGGWPGFSGNIAYSPAQGIAVAVLINMSAEARSDLGVRMIAALAGKRGL